MKLRVLYSIWRYKILTLFFTDILFGSRVVDAQSQKVADRREIGGLALTARVFQNKPEIAHPSYLPKHPSVSVNTNRSSTGHLQKFIPRNRFTCHSQQLKLISHHGMLGCFDNYQGLNSIRPRLTWLITDTRSRKSVVFICSVCRVSRTCHTTVSSDTQKHHF